MSTREGALAPLKSGGPAALNGGAPGRGISVIIPAHNAAKTLGETLDSLQHQTWPHWEAIIIDDGSSDATRSIAEERRASDARIRIHSQPQSGMAAARNTAIGLAQYDWMLCLDSDDWIGPDYFEAVFRKLDENPRLDAVCCDWACVGPDGNVHRTCRTSGLVGDLFPRFARGCVFAIHACVFRKALLENAGLFDPTLRTCADWDFWQRLSRAGAQFGALPEVLAFYRLHWGSSATDGNRIFKDGLRVIERGHAPDARVKQPAPEHLQGRPQEGQGAAQLSFGFYCAGLLLASQRDAEPLLHSLPSLTGADLQVSELAEGLFYGFLHVAISQGKDELVLWQATSGLRHKLLAEMERWAGRVRLAASMEAALDRLAIQRVGPGESARVGHLQRARLDLEQPLPNFQAEPGVRCCQFDVSYAGTGLGKVELPVCDGVVSRYVLEDVIASQFTWELLKLYFARNTYPSLRVERSGNEVAIWRGHVPLGTYMIDGRPDLDLLHDTVGWTVFLQEFWDAPLSGAEFYPPEPVPKSVLTGSQIGTKRMVAVELAQPLTDIKTPLPEQTLEVRVAGVPIGLVVACPSKGLLSAESIRAAVIAQAGWELCRVAVREAIVGQPFIGALSLRERLRALAAARPVPERDSTHPGPGALQNKLPRDRSLLLVARRFPAVLGTSFSTRGALPNSLGALVREAARRQVEFCHEPPNGAEAAAHVFYCPELLFTRKSESNPFQRCSNAAEAVGPGSRQCAILRYGGIRELGAGGPDAAVGLDLLEQHLRALSAAGYTGITLSEWVRASLSRSPVPGKPCHLSFDHGSIDLCRALLPLLEEYRFCASVYFNMDALAENRAELAAAGSLQSHSEPSLELGAWSPPGQALAGFTIEELAGQLYRARLRLQERCDRPVFAFAFSPEDSAPFLRQVIGACGFACGVGCHESVARFQHDLLSLPRLGITKGEDPARVLSRIQTG